MLPLSELLTWSRSVPALSRRATGGERVPVGPSRSGAHRVVCRLSQLGRRAARYQIALILPLFLELAPALFAAALLTHCSAWLSRQFVALCVLAAPAVACFVPPEQSTSFRAFRSLLSAIDSDAELPRVSLRAVFEFGFDEKRSSTFTGAATARSSKGALLWTSYLLVSTSGRVTVRAVSCRAPGLFLPVALRFCPRSCGPFPFLFAQALLVSLNLLTESLSVLLSRVQAS